MNLGLVVNRCDIAHTVDLENGVRAYTNATCSNITTIEDNVEDIAITYKMINKKFEV